MKTAAVLVSLAIATLDSTLVQAAECTTEELTTISDIYSSAMSEGTASCPDLTTATDATTVDYCSNSDCMDFMSKMLDQLPDCSSGGVDLKAGLQAALDYCATGTADTSGILTGSSSLVAADASSSSAFATDSTSSSASTTDTSSSSVFRTQSPSATSSATDTSSDKVTANTFPPATGGSSSASSTEMAVSSAAFAVATFMFAVGF